MIYPSILGDTFRFRRRNNIVLTLHMQLRYLIFGDTFRFRRRSNVVLTLHAVTIFDIG